jgi:phosphoribosylformylglycinamidine synthase
MEFEKRVQAAAREIVSSGLAESAHDLSDGGLAVALAECAFSDQAIGAAVDIDSALRPEFLLFHEGPSRVILSTSDPAAVEAIAAKHGVPAPIIGTTQTGRLRISSGGRTLIDTEVRALRDLWEGALPGLLNG